ncbi:MAG: branched-chain amino acid ABC transporter substrate-binding protein, partial [Firmicutes bacterium]|nr:branched-chain amino acid ABC transporter substrate-binding protein [Bacillota bacterium]
KKFAITYDTSSYGLGNADDFEKEVKKNGGEVLFKDGVQVGQRDFTAMLTKIKQLNPEVIYYGGVAAEAALIRKQMDDLKIGAIFTGVSGLNSETYQQLAGPCAEGTIINYGGKDVSELPDGQAFIKKYQEAGFKEPYQAYGPYAYDAANIIIEALKKVGPDKKGLVEEIRKAQHSGVLGKTSFDEYGDTTNTQIITTAVSQDGKWIPWEKSDYAKGTKKLPFVKQ